MKKSVVIIVFSLLSIVAIASLGVAIYSYSQVQSTKKTASSGAAGDDKKMLEAIASAMVLPSEAPTIITVTDREKLQDQEFFKKAQNGDKVVIYESIRRIFLFRPSINKIVDVAPLVFNEQQPVSQPAPTSADSTKSAQTVTPTIPKAQTQPEASSAAGSIGAEEQGNFELR